jgi:hypothetical protein
MGTNRWLKEGRTGRRISKILVNGYKFKILHRP